MIRRNLNYNFKPQTPIKTPQDINNNKTGGEKTKPTIQNMADLYKIYCESEIVYFPAAAATASTKKRTEALETYIKNNNLNIESVQNLEHFFIKVKEETYGKLGGMASIQAQDKMFNDYIEKGYDPTVRTEALLKPTMDELGNEYNNIVKNRIELKPQIEDIRNNYQLTEDIERIDAIVKNNIQKSFDIFK